MEMSKEEVLQMMNDNGQDATYDVQNDSDYISDTIILLDTDRLSNFSLDEASFKKGIDSVSELCGAITALVNVGITPSKAMEYLIDKAAAREAMAHNIEMANIQAKATVESSKYESVAIQKNSL